MDRQKLEAVIREELERLREYSYSDGAILFETSYCTPEEREKLNNSGMMDTLTRRLADAIIENADDIMAIITIIP